MTRHLTLQSKYATSPLPDGWANNAMVVSGHWFLWGRDDDAEDILSADGYSILQKASSLKDPATGQFPGKPGDALCPDLEGGLRFQQLPLLSDANLARAAKAIDLRLQIARWLGGGRSTELYIPGVAIQSQPTARDLDTFAAIHRLARLGAFRHLDAFWLRCYADRGVQDAGFDKLKDSMNSLRHMARSWARAAGRDIKLVCGLSWELSGSGANPLTEPEALRLQEEWARNYGFDRVDWYTGDERLSDGSSVMDKMRDYVNPVGRAG
ncbi:MAG: hypothetical protein DWQ20_00950 [Actinobacteria bacterium]|nr:MAG: hypothetical protein DWQ20_00950 [Actinomycetota bacterium]